MQKSAAFKKTFTVGDKIGQGSFGAVFRCRNKQSNKACVVKVESANAKHPQLRYEARVYKHLKGLDGFPRVFHYSTDGKQNYLVMQSLGFDLEKIRQSTAKKRLDLPTIAAMGIRGLQRLEALHETGFVHRDVKPQNLLLAGRPGEGKGDELYLVDFGLSKRFVTAAGTHVRRSGGRTKMTGTPRFASIHTHEGWTPTRRDDVEGLLYTLIYLYKGSLPWQGLAAPNKAAKMRLIGEKKKNTSPTTLCRGLPADFTKMLRHVRGLSFKQRPPYQAYIKVLRNMLLRDERAHSSRSSRHGFGRYDNRKAR